MKKRIFSFLLVLVMVLGMVPVTAFAAVDLPVSGGTVDVEDTTVGPYTVKTLDVYLQSSYAPVSIISATQDGNTINIVLAADTDPSAALQARFGGNGSGVLQHSGNKCSLSGGTGTMTYAIAVMMGPQIAGSSTYTINFSMPVGNSYKVTAPTGEGFDFSGNPTVNEGSSYTFTVTPKTGYDGANMVVKVNGEPILGSNGSYTVESVSSDLTITVEGVVKKTVYTVNAPTEDGFDFTGDASVYAGDSYQFTVMPKEGFNADNMVVAVNGQTVIGNNGTYTVENVSDNLTITVTGITQNAAHVVTAPTGKGFRFTGASSAYGGEIYTFTVAVRTGYDGTNMVVKVNGDPVTDSNGSYTVAGVSEDLVITVEGVTRLPLPTTQLPVADNVVDITDKSVYTLSSFYAKAVNITVAGAAVKEAYEDGTNVYMILTEDTADNAQINVTFGTSLNRCTMEGTTGSLTLDGGEGDLSMTLTGKYSGNRKGTATYNLVFFREDPATEPPTRLVATDAKEIYKSTSVTLNLRTYFEKASKYYLVVDGVNTPIDGYQYTFTAANPGQQTLVFAAANTVGNCPDTVSVTFNVLDITSGVWVGQTSSNGSWNFVQFKDAEGNLIQGVDAKVEGKNIEVVLPQNFDPNGKVSAVFSLTQNNGLPVLTTKTATSGTSSSQWNGNTFTSKTTTLSSGKASYTFYYCNQSPKNESPVTWTLSYKIFNNPPALTQGQAATAEATITAGEAFALDLAPLFVDAENDALTYLVSIDGATPIAADANYSFTTDVAKTYSLVFTANDGKDTSTDTYTVILTVENTTQTDSMTVFVPKGLEPKFYVSPSFEVVTRLRRLVKLTMR